MLNDKDFFWKNFRLGSELHIAGAFIYDALYCVDLLETLYNEDECFDFLYKASVGIERLEKIAVILLEHSQDSDQVQFEKSLITHNHVELINRIKKATEISLGKQHMKFLQMLSDFYNSTRYNRYNVNCVFKPNDDQKKLVVFLEECLKSKINNSNYFEITEVDKQVKKFLGKILVTIASMLYKIIYDTSHKIGTFTYEIRYGSKAFKIFLSKDYTFEKERLLQKELLVFLVNNQESMLHELIKEIKPLDFSNCDIGECVKSLFNIHKNDSIMGELEYLYEEQDTFDKERAELISLIGTTGWSINPEDYE